VVVEPCKLKINRVMTFASLSRGMSLTLKHNRFNDTSRVVLIYILARMRMSLHPEIFKT
jgi:hypothetical protein